MIYLIDNEQFIHKFTIMIALLRVNNSSDQLLYIKKLQGDAKTKLNKFSIAKTRGAIFHCTY